MSDDDDLVRPLEERDGEVEVLRVGPVVAGADLLAVHEEFEAVVAGHDAGRGVDVAGEHELTAESTGLTRGRHAAGGDVARPDRHGDERLDDGLLDGGDGRRGARDLELDLRRRGARQAPDGVDELLGGQPLGARTAVGVTFVVGVAREDFGAGLISLRGGDEGEHGLEVVAGLDEAVGEHVEEVLVPRLGLHRVDGVDDAASHQPMPEAVDDGALVPAVLRMGDERGKLGEALLARLGGIDLTELRIRPGGHGRLAGRDVAADEFHGPVRVDGGEAVGVAQLPAVGEAVVTRGALHVDAEERLRDALRELQLGDLARAHRAAPDDALGEAFAIGGRRHEFAREAVIRFVREQGEVEPVGDLLATTVDIPGAGVIITQQVVPEDHPVVGVIDVTGEERADERLALVGTGIGREGAGFFGGRQ